MGPEVAAGAALAGGGAAAAPSLLSTIAPYALSAASALMQGMAQQSATKKQRALADQMAQYRSEQAAKSRAAIEQFLEQQTPEIKAQERSQVTDELRAGLQDSVGAVQRFEAPQVIAGKVSPEYQDRRTSNEAAVGDRVRKAIEQLTGIGTQGELGMREARRFGQTSSGIDANNRAAGNVSMRYSDAINQVRPDPFLSFAAQLAQGVGMAAAGGAFNKTAALNSPIRLTPGGGTGFA